MFHFNDTEVPLGASRDRHWHIGEGRIGFEGFRALLAHPALRDKTAILETPGNDADDVRNMQTILAIQTGRATRCAGGVAARSDSSEQRRIGALHLEPQLDVGDVGDERSGTDGIAKHCSLLTDVVTFNHYIVVTVTCQQVLTGDSGLIA